MPPSEKYKLTLTAKSKLRAYKESREKMNNAKAKFNTAREKTASKRAEALCARKTLLENFPDADLPDEFFEDHESTSDADVPGKTKTSILHDADVPGGGEKVTLQVTWPQNILEIWIRNRQA